MSNKFSSAEVNVFLLVLILLSVVGCSLIIGDDDPRWDTNVPEGEAFDSYLGIWSPDGTKIAFQHHEPLTSPDPGLADQLWIADLETVEREMVHSGRILAADWSPDGRWFVFHSFSDPENLFKLDVHGRHMSPLTGPNSPNPDLEYAATGDWSPDGGTILFSIVAGEPRGISRMDPDGSKAQLLIPYGIQPDWFPDGERIAYVNWDTTLSYATGRMRQIYTARPDGSDTRKLTDLAESSFISTPTVSPDGRKIAFVYRGKDRSAELFLMNPDGTNVRQVTNGPGIVSRPEWHPSGEKILFGRFIPNVSRRLYVLEVGTLEVEPLFGRKIGD